MTTWTVFATGSPANGGANDNTRYTLATGWLINQPGSFWCTGIEWFAPTTLPTEDITIGLFLRVDDVTPGALLASKVISSASLTPGARNALLFDPGDEVLVSQAQAAGYYAAVWTPNWYTVTSGYFGVDDVSGPITAWTNGGIGANGRFAADVLVLTYPNGAFGGSGYWMSPIVTDEDPGGATDLDLTDTPGSLLLGGSSDVLVSADVLADQPGPLLLAGSPESLVQELALVDRPGGVLLAGSPEELVQVPATPLDLTDQLGPGVLAAGSPDVLSVSSAQTDESIWPVLVQALACLEDAVDALPVPPLHRSIRSGNSIVAGVSPSQDECCEGLAWVRVVSISPTNAFPTPESSWSNCPPAELAVELELGILRCSPYADGGQNEFLVPTTAQHLAAAQAIMNDGAAMRRAACCLGELRPVIIGTGQPVETEANCMGSTLRVTVAAPFCERTC